MNKLEKIISLVKEYAEENLLSQPWKEGDWINYSGPNFSSDEYVAAVQTLLNGWLVVGEKSRKFEIDFPAHLGKSFGVLTNSGSSANLLMVHALTSKQRHMREYHLPPGSKIITPVVCFPTTLNPIIQAGYKPVFVDVDLPSLNLNLDEVEKILKEDESIKAIMFAHVLGNPPDMDRVMHLVEKYNLIFLEDSCDALGSFYDGRKLGSYGKIASCSFYPAHHMTMGEGGFVATDEARIRRVLASFRDWGRACYCNEMKPGDVTCGTACGDRFKSWLKSGQERFVYDHRYVFDEIGFNLKPLELQAAIGLQQLKKLPDMDQARRLNFRRLKKIFSKYEEYFLLPEATPKSDPCWFGFMLTVKKNEDFTKQDLVNHLEKHRIQTRSYFTGNCLYHPAYSELALEYKNLRERFPNAHTATVDTFFMGTYIGITEEKLNYTASVVDDFFERL
jgi:CDP-6-deoxy-D-xylo-4-hexulose-3-dehydrase